MKKIIITCLLATVALLACKNNSPKQIDTTGYIQHTVMFNLRHEDNSLGEKKFLEDGQKTLSAIPSVIDFEIKRQISAKNSYNFYFTMYFEDEKAYKAYNIHPEHLKFVKDRWEVEVTDFLEADFIYYP